MRPVLTTGGGGLIGIPEVFFVTPLLTTGGGGLIGIPEVFFVTPLLTTGGGVLVGVAEGLLERPVLTTGGGGLIGIPEVFFVTPVLTAGGGPLVGVADGFVISVLPVLPAVTAGRRLSVEEVTRKPLCRRLRRGARRSLLQLRCQDCEPFPYPLRIISWVAL